MLKSSTYIGSKDIRPTMHINDRVLLGRMHVYFYGCIVQAMPGTNAWIRADRATSCLGLFLPEIISPGISRVQPWYLGLLSHEKIRTHPRKNNIKHSIRLNSTTCCSNHAKTTSGVPPSLCSPPAQTCSFPNIHVQQRQLAE